MSECDPTEDEDGVTVCAAHVWFMAGIAPGGLCIEGRLIEAEAAIARVRERADGPTPAVHGDWMAGYAAAMRDILRVPAVTEYWKATNTDGTDFYSGRVDYAAALTSGEPLPELSGDGVFPGGGWYHLATVPTECMGMSWPCRLFEVEPVGDQVMDSEHPHKIGARSVRVLREVEAHRVFGPQGEQVVALIERCLTLSAVEVDRLAAAWDAAWAARNAACVAMDRLDAAWGAARDAAWAAARDAARNAAWAAMDRLGAARDAARDAAVALLCRDLTGQAPGWDQDAYDLLTGPWRDVIGPIHHDDGDSDD